MNESDRIQQPGLATTEGGILATNQSAFVGQVFWLVGLMIAGASAAGYLARDLILPGMTNLILFFVWFGLSFVVTAVRNKSGINIIAVLSHAVLSGVIVAPILRIYGAEVVMQAIVLTAVVVVALGTTALTIRYDFSGWGGYLFGGLLALIVTQVVGLFFFPGLITSPLIAGAGTVLFSLMLVYDIQRLKKTEATEGNAIMGAMRVYLDILNLFLFILRLLGAARR